MVELSARAQAHHSTVAANVKTIVHLLRVERLGVNHEYFSKSTHIRHPRPRQTVVYCPAVDNDELADTVQGYGDHATAILWKGTERIGCAVGKCFDGVDHVETLVCIFDPP